MDEGILEWMNFVYMIFNVILIKFGKLLIFLTEILIFDEILLNFFKFFQSLIKNLMLICNLNDFY